MMTTMSGRSTSAAALLLCIISLALPVAAQNSDEDTGGLGPPSLYDELRQSGLEAVGHIRGGRLTVDRVEFELTEGDLYLLRIDERPVVAVFLGDGLVRCYPPDGVEHQQLEKFHDDDDVLEEEFDRFVFWFADDLGTRLEALADNRPGRDLDDANDLLEDRREFLLEKQLWNADARLVIDLLNNEAHGDAGQPYFYAQIDSDDNDWIAVEVEPQVREEVVVYRFDERHDGPEVWLRFHALRDFDAATRARVFEGFPRDPAVEGKVEQNDDDDDDWHARDLGLSPRPLRPHEETWRARVSVDRTDVDLALEGNGDATTSAALVIDPLDSFSAFRLRISSVLEVTDVRWKPLPSGDVHDVRNVALLTGSSPNRGEPAALDGESVHFIQERHNRRMEDDRWEPWVVVALPRAVSRGERFILELAYEGPLLEELQASDNYVLKDTMYWMPRHTDTRQTRMSLTYRMPEGLQVASGSALVEEHVEDGVRVERWISEDPVPSMSFNYGRFDVQEVTLEGLPPIAVYADERHLGFAPGNREKTIADLSGALTTYSDYFGPYPFDSLLVTETPTTRGQAFPGLVLLSFQAFGEMHTGEAEVFRAHEVAHQWWGAAVDWYDYRDQWLSEGFAEYSAALYMAIGLQAEEEFLEMLDAWRLDILAEVSVGQGLGLRHYGFLPQVIRRSDGHLSGPLVVGSRLVTGDSPIDYRLLIYEKGAYVLHMLRMMMLDLDTGDDTRFRELMRTFVADHLYGVASTVTFEAAVTAAFGAPMDWFFDQWVYGVDVPTYRPNLDVTRTTDQDHPFVLHGTIGQQDVPTDFRMPVPIVVWFDDHPPLAHRVWVEGRSVEVEIPLPAEPRDIAFNYHHGVLARVR